MRLNTLNHKSIPSPIEQNFMVIDNPSSTFRKLQKSKAIISTNHLQQFHHLNHILSIELRLPRPPFSPRFLIALLVVVVEKSFHIELNSLQHMEKWTTNIVGIFAQYLPLLNQARVKFWLKFSYDNGGSAEKNRETAGNS